MTTSLTEVVTPVANVSFHLLDQPVIEGYAEHPLFVTADGRSWSHARTLEEVAALGGVLRHLGVERGTPVRLALGTEHDLEAVVAALATARLGGVVATEGGAAVVVASQGSDVTAEEVRLVRGESVAEPDLDWAVMLRAGRTDPAACEVLAAEAAYSTDRSVARQLELLAAHEAPFEVGELRSLLQA